MKISTVVSPAPPPSSHKCILVRPGMRRDANSPPYSGKIQFTNGLKLSFQMKLRYTSTLHMYSIWTKIGHGMDVSKQSNIVS